MGTRHQDGYLIKRFFIQKYCPPQVRPAWFAGEYCCRRQLSGFATLRQKAGKGSIPVCICFLRCVLAVFMLCTKYHRENTRDMHGSPDRVRPSLRLILSGSGNTAWEQVSDQGCHNRVYNMCILFFCPAGGLSFMREPVRNRCGQRLCRGTACLAGQAFATLRQKAGKDRPHPACR